MSVDNFFNRSTNALYNSVTGLWNDIDTNYGLLVKKDILRIGNILQNIFENGKNKIEIPKIVVVGSQSSGKSSLLNGILSFELLPTGKNMVTRTPLHLELIPNENNLAEFGQYKNGKWFRENKLPFSLPTPTTEEKNNILKTIEIKTNKIAGKNSNISDKPIYLKIYSKDIPNLTLIDLPGLTMVACTDRGQPSDIKDKIRTLIGKYINSSKTIILSVMPARTDLEADIALDLIKEYDPKGLRTIGILTKVDLMNDNTDISDYLSNNISKDLQLYYGYYAVRNRTTIETNKISILEGFQKEKLYFENHPIYGNMKDKSHLGIPNMTNKISDILVHKIKKNLPFILDEINQTLFSMENELLDLGTNIPKSEEGKISLIHSLISNLTCEFVSVIEDRGVMLNTGRNIKNIFIKFRESIEKYNPFLDFETNKEYIENSIKNCEGNHMSFPSPPVEVLEQCLKDKKLKPIGLLIEPSKKCNQNICTELLGLLDKLLSAKKISRFPFLVRKIKNELMGDIITSNIQTTNKKIEEIILMEENYIWTDDKIFKNTLKFIISDQFNTQNGKNNIEHKIQNKIENKTINRMNGFRLKNHVSTKQTNIENMNILLKTYYDTIIENVKNSIPKIIMYFLVKKTELDMSEKFYERILKEPTNNLLKEIGHVHDKRCQLHEEKQKLIFAKKSINELI